MVTERPALWEARFEAFAQASLHCHSHVPHVGEGERAGRLILDRWPIPHEADSWPGAPPAWVVSDSLEPAAVFGKARDAMPSAILAADAALGSPVFQQALRVWLSWQGQRGPTPSPGKPSPWLGCAATGVVTLSDTGGLEDLMGRLLIDVAPAHAAAWQLVLTEALTNALYHAPQDGEGRRRYRKGQPLEALPARDQPTISWGHQDGVLYVSVTDRWGTLSAETLYWAMARHYRDEGILDTHGRGLFLMHHLSLGLSIRRVAGQWCDVILALGEAGPQQPGLAPLLFLNG